MAKFIVDGIGEGTVTLRVAGMNYQNTFLMKGGAGGLQVGQRVQGRILAPAWKVDRVEMGGNYVEPLMGRPRRMQGTILSVNAAANELTVRVGYEVTVVLPEKYRAGDFAVGERVGWDNVNVPVFVVGTGQVTGEVAEELGTGTSRDS
jgi:hypothetical protein